MAGVLDEYDEATPLRGTFCSRLTAEEFEEQGASCTEEALSQLMEHLETNPEAYGKVLKQRKRQQAEEAGLFSFVKTRLWTFWAGEDAGYSVSDTECEKEIEKLKQEMTKVYNYSQESKGRRFSKRLAEKRLRALQQENVPPPPTPPPLPPPPPSLRTPQLCTALTRRPISERRPFSERRAENNRGLLAANANSVDLDTYKRLMGQLRGSGCRKRLRTTAEKSPGGTPVCGWPKRHREPDMLPYFNTKLIEKFQNVKSPGRSPLASPGTFDSPTL